MGPRAVRDAKPFSTSLGEYPRQVEKFSYKKTGRERVIPRESVKSQDKERRTTKTDR